MAATIELDEYNGAGPETAATITHNVTNLNYGSADAANLIAADNPITPNTNTYKGSFAKYTKLHVTNMGGVSKVNTIKFWRVQGSPTAGDLHRTNATTSGYANKTYQTPTTALLTFYNVESSEPSGANVGINSALAGEITSVAVNSLSDFMWHQVQVSSSTTVGAVMTTRVQWNEVA